jgi:hypothetical protein
MPKANRYSVLRNDPVQHHIYRGYLIRWSPFTVIKPDNCVWVEKDNAFICWANNVDEAKTKIDQVLN